MSNYYPGKDKDYGTKIDDKEFIISLNNLLDEGNGILLDCFLPDCRSAKYPTGISKPLPFLKAIKYQQDLILVMLEYRLYLNQDDDKRLLGLKLEEDSFNYYKDGNLIKLIYNNQEIILDLDNSFEFDYDLDEDSSLPVIDFWQWAKTPFV